MTHTNTEAVSDLLPCPFCGGEAYMGADDAGNPEVKCIGECHPAETETEAIAAWNRRAANSAGGVEVKALLDAYDAETSKIPLGHEDRGRGASSYNWRRSVVDDLRKLAAAFSAVEAEPVAPTERLKLHRKIMGMIADKQRYAGVMIDGRELHVIAEALLDRAIEVERSSPVSAEVTVTDEQINAISRDMEVRNMIEHAGRGFMTGSIGDASKGDGV